MSSRQVRSNDATASASVASVDMKLEVSSSPSRMSIAQRSSVQGSGGGSTPTAPQVTTFAFSSSRLPVPAAQANSACTSRRPCPVRLRACFWPSPTSRLRARNPSRTASTRAKGFTVQPGLPAGFQATASGSAGHTPSVSVTGRLFRSVVPIGSPAFNRSLGAKWPRI
jgi:hypothetical protein